MTEPQRSNAKYEDKANALLQGHQSTIELRDRIAFALKDVGEEAVRRMKETNRDLHRLLSKAASEIDLIKAQYSGDGLGDALDTLRRMVSPIEVIKITSKDGGVFYSPVSDALDVSNLSGVASLRVVDMSEEEYQNIPATTEAVLFFAQKEPPIADSST